jgi:2-polyprenyl-3-methyl-5-hydroxy-6-metoxy-1,4-benzoquinol methylase
MKRISTVNKPKVETINCPYCGETESLPWARENGFTAVKCSECGIVYVNPCPLLSLISETVKTGVHSEIGLGRAAIAHRVGAKVPHYKKLLSSMFNDVWNNSKRICWLDVGAGYGEVVEALSTLAPPGSKIEGIEPMKSKAEHAKKRGLAIHEAYLSDVDEKYDFLSLVNVFSHIPDFRDFLTRDVKRLLKRNGEIFIETGNIGDLNSRQEIQTELNLPDHLVFAGEKHIVGYLLEAGFEVLAIRRIRKDGLIDFVKNIVKKIIGRRVVLAIPYTSFSRSILIRAKLL